MTRIGTYSVRDGGTKTHVSSGIWWVVFPSTSRTGQGSWYADSIVQDGWLKIDESRNEKINRRTMVTPAFSSIPRVSTAGHANQCISF